MVRCFGDIGPDQAVSSRHPLESDLVIISVASGGAPLLPGHPRYVAPVFGFVNVIEKTPIKGGYPSTDTGLSLGECANDVTTVRRSSP